MRLSKLELELIKSLKLPDTLKGILVDSEIGYYGTLTLKYQLSLPNGLLTLMVPITFFMTKDEYPDRQPPQETDFSQYDAVRHLYEIKKGDKTLKILFYHKDDFFS